MGGWVSLFPLSRPAKPFMSQMERTLSYLKTHSSDLLPDMAPPPCDTIMWNVDASFKPHLNHAAVGGVLRNSLGNFICLFSSPIPLLEINSAEVFAIFRATQISINSERIKNNSITIVSDSCNAVQWCNLDKGGPWNLNFMLNYIRNARKQWLSLSIVHKGRETNGVAHSLAKQGLSRKDEFLAWC